jgi:hypothetical protein
MLAFFYFPLTAHKNFLTNQNFLRWRKTGCHGSWVHTNMDASMDRKRSCNLQVENGGAKRDVMGVGCIRTWTQAWTGHGHVTYKWTTARWRKTGCHRSWENTNMDTSMDRTRTCIHMIHCALSFQEPHGSQNGHS